MAGAAATVLLAAAPLSVLAQGNFASSCPVVKPHALPKSSGSSPATVFSFGSQGGNIRSWTIKLNLDGTISADGTTVGRQQLTDPKNTLQGLLALADAEGFFSMKKLVGCLGTGANPDSGNRFLAIHTASGTKRVKEFGSCAATAKYDQLYAVVQETSGFGM
jgi:hypothetical protein